MKKLFYFFGPCVFAVLICFVFMGLNHFMKDVFGVSIVTTYVDGNVLTAAQLNGNNNAIFNAFNAHDHDGGDGESSTLSPSAIDTALDFTSDGDIEIGSKSGTATGTSAPGLTIIGDTGDARLSLKVNNSAANTWMLLNDNSDSDFLHIRYNNINKLIVDGTSAETSLKIQETGSDDAVLYLEVNSSTSNAWGLRNKNSDSDSLYFEYAGTAQQVFETDGDVILKGAVATGNNGSSHAINWKTFSGTTCTYTTADCTTTIVSATPGTGAPFGALCFVSNGTYNFAVGNTSDGVSTGANVCVQIRHNISTDALELFFTGDSSCVDGEYSEQSYKCIVYYQ